nr:AzlD domain-containing protein [Microvirga antarctica]
MALATYLCRIGGVLLMTRVKITPRAERGLRALPGSIIVATTLPLIVNGGLSAFVSVAVAAIAMALTRVELAGLAAGLGTLSILRAFGV